MLMNNNIDIIKENNENYAVFKSKNGNRKKEQTIKIPLKTNNKTLLETRLNHIKTKGYFIFEAPVYLHKNPVGHYYYKDIFPWLDNYKEIKKNRTNKMHKEELSRRRNAHKKDPRARLRSGARDRAIEKNIEFELATYKDLPKVPEKCPILNIPLIVGNKVPTDNSPSLDRINNDKGYTKDNIQIISRKANQMKSNASFKDIEKLYLHMKKGEK